MKVQRECSLGDQRRCTVLQFEGVKFELILDGQAIVILVKNMGGRDIPDSGMCEGTQVRENLTPTTIIMVIIVSSLPF